MILSVSRRTDIPAFYSKWFIKRVKEGYVLVRNPFNANQISRIPLTSDIVDCIVFWSKNPQPMLEYLPLIAKKYNNAFYFQYTINGYERDIEPALPSLDSRIETFKSISATYGSERVVWRYDPVFLSSKYSMEWHIQEFRTICYALKQYTDTCVISFIDMYVKTKSNMKGLDIHTLDTTQMELFAKAVSEIAAEIGITIRTCAEAIDLSKYGILPNSCVDKARIERITGCTIEAKADRQREACRCIECADIGEYNTCGHGCRYCYATYNGQRVKTSMEKHSDDSPLLIGEVEDGQKITDYSKAKSLKVGGCNGQISFL